MKGRAIRTAEKKKFLDALATGLSATGAAEKAGLGRTTVYEHREKDPKFAAAWDAAIEAGTDRLEDIAMQRAEDKSDLLTIFMLKARRPDRYKERKSFEIGGNSGKPLKVSINLEKVNGEEGQT